MSDRITKTFNITANAELMGQIERFLACLHLYTNWGHSAMLALSEDGDGMDHCTVEGEDFNPSKYRVYADWISRYGPKERKVEVIDCSLKDTDYIAYKEEWTKKHGHLYEDRPWEDENE